MLITCSICLIHDLRLWHLDATFLLKQGKPEWWNWIRAIWARKYGCQTWVFWGTLCGVQRIKAAHCFVTASNPPTPVTVQKWLDALHTAHLGEDSQHASPASFGMNPNTGALVPGNVLSQDSQGGAHESDLLGTPLFQSPPPNPGSAIKSRIRPRLSHSSQTPHGPAQKVSSLTSSDPPPTHTRLCNLESSNA